MAALTQTITIVDKSNKVVSASKQLKGVFTEAKFAYLARKAEIKAERQKKEEVELQKAIKACSIADYEARSETTSAYRSRRNEGVRRKRSEHKGAREYRSGSNSPPTPNRQMSLGEFNQQLYGQGQSYSTPVSPYASTPDLDPTLALQRRRTDQEFPLGRRASTSPQPLTRSYSATDIDLDLAYGEYHEPDLLPLGYGGQARGVPNALIPLNQEKELSSLVLKCKMLLEEADCAGQSVKAIITHLQSNPDAMAAVALTLAEISNIAAKLAPGALASLKGTAPAVLALLASPQFLVAVGVGVGVTVVMFGGYKIIKKIKATAEGRAEGEPIAMGVPGVRAVDIGQGGELLDVKELDRIEKWRRGIADTDPDAETGSIISGYSAATSVEGEFITPFAAQSMGHLPLPKDKLKSKSKSSSSSSKTDKESDKDKDKDGKEKKKHRKHRHSDKDSVDSDGASSAKSDASSGSKRRGSRELVKVTKPSPLRRMFTVHGTSSSTGWER